MLDALATLAFPQTSRVNANCSIVASSMLGCDDNNMRSELVFALLRPALEFLPRYQQDVLSKTTAYVQLEAAKK